MRQRQLHLLEIEWLARQLKLGLGHLAVLVELDGLVAVGEIDEGVAVLEPDRGEGPGRDRGLSGVAWLK